MKITVEYKNGKPREVIYFNPYEEDATEIWRQLYAGFIGLPIL